MLVLGGLATAFVACSGGDAPIPTATPEQPTATAQPTGIARDEAIQLAVQLTLPLFDQLHSLGQYTTIARVESMSLGELATLVGDAERAGDESTAKRLWVVEIEIKLIGTPDGPEPAYSLIGIDAEDGGLELIRTLQSPLLPANTNARQVTPISDLD